MCTLEVTDATQCKASMQAYSLSNSSQALMKLLSLLVKALLVGTCLKESRFRWFLSKCGETLSERLLKGERIRRRESRCFGLPSALGLFVQI